MMTITVVCLFLVYQFSGSAGLLYQNRDHNESVKSDHDLLTQFEQKLRNLTDEVNSLKALEIEMGHLKKENRWLINEVQICNQTLGSTSKTVDNLMKQTRYLSVSMLDFLMCSGYIKLCSKHLQYVYESLAGTLSGEPKPPRYCKCW